MQAGHAKKLVPIILSLDRYDNNPAAWQPLKERVEQMTIGLDNLILDCVLNLALDYDLSHSTALGLNRWSIVL